MCLYCSWLQFTRVLFYCNVCYLVEKCRCGKEDSAGALVWFSATLLCILDSWGQYPKSIDTMPNEDEELPGYHAAADRPSCSNAWYTVESADKLMKFRETLLTLYQILEREGQSSEARYLWSSSSSFGIVLIDFRYWPQESTMKRKVAENHISSRTFPKLHHTIPSCISINNYVPWKLSEI